MASYTCLLLKKSQVLELADIEATNDEHALKVAMARRDTWPECTYFDLWRDGLKVRHRAPSGVLRGSKAHA